MKKDLDEIRFDLYNDLLDSFGDEYEYFHIDIKMYNKKPRGMSSVMNGDYYQEMLKRDKFAGYMKNKKRTELIDKMTDELEKS